MLDPTNIHTSRSRKLNDSYGITQFQFNATQSKPILLPSVTREKEGWNLTHVCGLQGLEFYYNQRSFLNSHY